jgi:pre-mRNA-splicing factor 18
VTKKRYLKRGEIEAIQEQQIQSAKLPQSSASQQPQSKTTSSSTTNGSTSTHDKSKSNSSANDHDEDDIQMTEEDLISRLRARGEPIKLFGETMKDRIRRLRILESMEERTDGQRNDFQSLLENADKGLALELLAKQAGISSAEEFEKRNQKKREKEEDAMDVSAISPALLDVDPEKTRTLIGVYYRRLLREWEKSLNGRSDDVKRSTQGKLQAATQAQAVEYLKPFFKQLKSGTLQPDVLLRITEITMYIYQREYMKANDSYLRLSIGNAPWPIGVTMVGKYHAHINQQTRRKVVVI